MIGTYRHLAEVERKLGKVGQRLANIEGRDEECHKN